MPKRKAIYLEDVADQALRIVKRKLDEIDRLDRIAAKEMKESGEYAIDHSVMTALDKTTRALASLLKEIRALEKNAKESATKLGPTQLTELIYDHFSKLPEVNQRSMLLDLKEIYDDGRVSMDNQLN